MLTHDDKPDDKLKISCLTWKSSVWFELIPLKVLLVLEYESSTLDSRQTPPHRPALLAAHSQRQNYMTSCHADVATKQALGLVDQCPIKRNCTYCPNTSLSYRVDTLFSLDGKIRVGVHRLPSRGYGGGYLYQHAHLFGFGLWLRIFRWDAWTRPTTRLIAPPTTLPAVSEPIKLGADLVGCFIIRDQIPSRASFSLEKKCTRFTTQFTCRRRRAAFN